MASYRFEKDIAQECKITTSTISADTLKYFCGSYEQGVNLNYALSGEFDDGIHTINYQSELTPYFANTGLTNNNNAIRLDRTKYEINGTKATEKSYTRVIYILGANFGNDSGNITRDNKDSFEIVTNISNIDKITLLVEGTSTSEKVNMRVGYNFDTEHDFIDTKVVKTDGSGAMYIRPYFVTIGGNKAFIYRLAYFSTFNLYGKYSILEQPYTWNNAVFSAARSPMSLYYAKQPYYIKSFDGVSYLEKYSVISKERMLFSDIWEDGELISVSKTLNNNFDQSVTISNSPISYGATIVVTPTDFDVLQFYADCGLYFKYDNVRYKPLIDGGICIGYTTDLTANSDIDNWTDFEHDVPKPEDTEPIIYKDDIDDIGLNDFPFGSGGGLITYYALDRFDMDDFKVDIATIRSGVTVDPDKFIVGCWLLPIDLKVHTTSSRQAIKLGGTTTNASGYKITDAQKVFDFGSYSVEYNHNGSFLDYEPYTQVSLYVPYCGNIKIPTSLCMGRTVSVKMIVDIYSGGCRGCVFVGNTFYTSIGGSVSTNVPISVEQVASKTNALLNIGSTVLASAASGNIVASASAINSAMSTYNNIAPSVIGSVSDAILNFYLPQKCIISIVSPSVREEEYYKYHGKVNKTIKSIGQCSGFTACEKVHTDGITRATKSERARISQYLQSGIII